MSYTTIHAWAMLNEYWPTPQEIAALIALDAVIRDPDEAPVDKDEAPPAVRDDQWPVRTRPAEFAPDDED